MYDTLISLPRRAKRALVLGLDLALVPLAMGLSLGLTGGATMPLLMGGATLAAGPVLVAFGVPRVKVQQTEARALAHLGAATLVLGAIAAALGARLGAPVAAAPVFGACYFALTVAARLAVLGAFSRLRRMAAGHHAALVYGAGPEGVQIASALRTGGTLRPVAFVDENRAYGGLLIGGLRVHRPEALPRLVKRHAVGTVILALPGASAARRGRIAEEIRALGCKVRMVPSFAEMLERGGVEAALRPVRPDDLLGRDKVDLAGTEVARAFAGRTVMVTGAGGSIGSELCRQLVDCRPARIVLFEHSEFALYEIDAELRAMLAEHPEIEVISRLGSVTNAPRVAQVLEEDGVGIVLHAAAYKHVPLVEANEIEGARNNVIGTRTVAQAAIAAGCERFILVSTDKAVRPTNVMGATKRLAELVVQDLQTRSENTVLSMVRFGNVLGSSGSVLPLFQKQIARGGPVTVTHPEVTRFFMTIPEAARLVLLAGAYAEGGDVFVLDMGEAVKIADVARRMIELSGARVAVPGEPGGIAIKITGLRPGEKLYEELLIDDDTLTATPHPKILRAEEAHLSQIGTLTMMREVEASIATGDAERLRTCASAFVQGYRPPMQTPAPVELLVANGRNS